MVFHKTYPSRNNFIREGYQLNVRITSSLQGLIWYFKLQDTDGKLGTSPIVEKRSCTDVMCLILFIAFIGSWSFVAVLAFKAGDITTVLYPSDSMVNCSTFTQTIAISVSHKIGKMCKSHRRKLFNNVSGNKFLIKGSS